ncbi:MAG TPA: hypothetical protein VMB84_00770 [Stellaceae bacterium]|nr:hypothetical protein [Stellaceae bacterium]
MAKTAKRPAKPPPKKPGMRPVLLAAGLGLFWFVQYQELGGAEGDLPMWSYMTMIGVRLLADFVGAWVIVSALQLAIALLRLALGYLRMLWLQAG